MLNKPNECGGSLCITKPDECGGSGMVEYIPPFTLLGWTSSTYMEHIRRGEGGGALFYYGKKLKTWPCSYQPGTGIIVDFFNN